MTYQKHSVTCLKNCIEYHYLVMNYTYIRKIDRLMLISSYHNFICMGMLLCYSTLFILMGIIIFLNSYYQVIQCVYERWLEQSDSTSSHHNYYMAAAKIVLTNEYCAAGNIPVVQPNIMKWNTCSFQGIFLLFIIFFKSCIWYLLGIATLILNIYVLDRLYLGCPQTNISFIIKAFS